jgi:hypothetical protein
MVPPDLPSGLEALSRMCRRHPDIDHYQRWCFLADKSQQFGTVASLTNDLEPRMLKQACQALA